MLSKEHLLLTRWHPSKLSKLVHSSKELFQELKFQLLVRSLMDLSASKRSLSAMSCLMLRDIMLQLYFLDGPSFCFMPALEVR